MTVDSYWEDGDRIHLMRDGVDLNVLRSRVRSLKQVDDHHEPAARPRASHEAADAPSGAASTTSGAKASREELEAKESAIEKHLLRVQQERFEAKARGDDAAKVRRLDKEFGRTATRRQDVQRALTKE